MNASKEMLISRFLVKLIGLVTDIVVTILALRIILKLFGASASASFVVWVYDTTKPLLAPFQGMFPSPEIAPRLTIEFSAVFALIVYSFIGYLLTDAVRVMNVNANGSKGK